MTIPCGTRWRGGDMRSWCHRKRLPTGSRSTSGLLSAASCRYQPWGRNTVEDTKRFVADAIASCGNDPQDRYVWAGLNARADVIGLGELHVRSRRWRQGEVAYAVHTRHWGSGIATAIATQLVGFAFDRLGLHRVAATCDPRNVASAAVLRKVGMTREGRVNLAASGGLGECVQYNLPA